MAVLNDSNNKPAFARFSARHAATTTEALVAAIKRDGGVIIESLITHTLADQIRADLKPHFDRDIPDKWGLFPATTQRATGLLGYSDGCVELACNPLYISIANALISSNFSFWRGDRTVTVSGKPIISSTVGFRVNPGGTQQVLHRDDK
jgi:ectoine hydroxylase-related dioxygenase (phytanoyl-CoA dioxygenase family)